jgi:shikimate dehydrogenase
MVINATSAGMQGADEGRAIADALISATLDSRSTAYDLVYRPWPGRRETPFIAEARARGLAAHDGLGMLVFQAARALELWLDRPLGPPVVEAMMAAARVAIDAPANG